MCYICPKINCTTAKCDINHCFLLKLYIDLYYRFITLFRIIMARILTILILLAAFAFAARTTYETNNDNFTTSSLTFTEDTLNNGSYGYMRIKPYSQYLAFIGWNLASLSTSPVSSCSLSFKWSNAASADIISRTFWISTIVDTFYEGASQWVYDANGSSHLYKQGKTTYWLGNAANHSINVCNGNNGSVWNSWAITNNDTSRIMGIPIDLSIYQKLLAKTAYGLCLTETTSVGGNYALWSRQQGGQPHPTLIINTYTLNNPTSSPCSLVFSVGTSTNDFKTSSPTISISSGTATFSIAQTNDSMGVGDEVTFGTGAKVYLMRKSSTTQWRGTSPAGKWPDGVSGEPVLSIKRAFNSLNAAVSGSAPGAANVSHLNSMALTTTDTRLYIACYADGVDASMDTVRSTWTTDATRYITIFTPTNTSTECNTNQRHNGVINGGGYTLQSSFAGDYARNIDIGANYTKVIGLKIIRTSSNWSYGSCIGSYTTAGAGNNCEFAYNLLYQQSGGDYGCLIYNGNISTSDHYACSIHDNILVSGSSTLLWGIYYDGNYQTTAARQSKIYNNTVYGSYTSSGGAIRIVVNNSASSSYLPLVKNNYAANTGTGSDYIFGGADYSNANAEFAYNGSDDGTCGSSNSNTTITVANMAFVSTTSGSENLHIQSSSTANTKGIGPCSDNQVAATDIDGDSRLTSCAADIGADENLAFTAPDTVVRYINTASAPGGTGITNATSGTDRAYHSLLEWDDAEDGNLVVNNQIKVAVCEGSDVDDSGVVDLNGWTTDYQHYIVIRTDSTSAYGQHGGRWNTGTYRLEANGSSGAMIVRTDYIKISGLQIRNTNTGSTPAALLLLDYDPANNCNKYEISKCILRGSCDRGIYVYDDDANVFISNTICYLDYVGNTWPVYE